MGPNTPLMAALRGTKLLPSPGKKTSLMFEISGKQRVKYDMKKT